MEILAPRMLRPGSRVAIVASASPFESSELYEGLDVIKEAGLEPILGPNVTNLRSHNIHGASVQERVDELVWAYSDDSIDAIIVATGGMGSAAVLPYLPYPLIRQTRKAILGFSDVTALNNGVLAKAGLITVNGQTPSIRLDHEKYRMSDSESLRFALELMMSGRPWADRPFDLNERLPRCVYPGMALGHAIGGNLDTFSRLIGTEFMPDPAGAILFIEDVHRGGEDFGRELLHLKLAGVLDQLAGVVIGEFVDVPKKTDLRNPSMEDVIEEYFGSQGIPCSFGYSFSHGTNTIPIPIGATTTLDAATGEVNFWVQMA